MRGIWIVGLAALLTACSATQAEQPKTGMEALEWLSGTWINEENGEWTEERWSSVRANSMIGTGRSGTSDALNTFEFLRIGRTDEGAIAYFAAPGGSEPTRFALVKSDDSAVVFENPDHDFPQRISYARNGKTLDVAISTIDGSQEYSWSLTLDE